MKLITETFEDIKYITEAKEDGGKNLYITGPFLVFGEVNRNGRMYNEQIMDREVARYMKEAVENNTAMGELGHPNGPQINLDRVSHKIVSLVKEGNEKGHYVGKALIAVPSVYVGVSRVIAIVVVCPDIGCVTLT